MNEIQDEGRIKRYDATKYLRQMKHLPDVTPLCGVLVLLVALFMIPIWGGLWLPFMDLPEANYAHHEPLMAPTVLIKNNGSVYFNQHSIENQDQLNLLPVMIEDFCEELQVENSKVLFNVGDKVPWSKVRDVMDVLKKSKIEVAGFITERWATPLDFFYMQKLYREKNLRLPASAK